MKKIRKFKLPVHDRELLRRIGKSGLNLKELAIEDENQVKEFAYSLVCETEPSVIYETFDNDFAGLGSLFDIFTAGVLTLGSGLDKKIDSLSYEEHKKAAQICALEFLDSGFDFVINLITEEAKKENFETAPVRLLFFPKNAILDKNSTLSPRFIRKTEILPDEDKKKVIPLLTEKLKVGKISVSLNENRIIPDYTIIFLVQWMRKKRRKK